MSFYRSTRKAQKRGQTSETFKTAEMRNDGAAARVLWTTDDRWRMAEGAGETWDVWTDADPNARKKTAPTG